MQNHPFDFVTQPTLLVDEQQARKNISFMAEKARAQGVHFRPHFKTHQSAEVGGWFRAAGVKAITVSSVSMARYFAGHGWKDITIAFPFNWREMDALNTLADHNHLELLVESVETARFLQEHLRLLTEVWIKVDVGAHRAGIDWQDGQSLRELVNTILDCKKLILRGFLTHDGRSYHASSAAEISAIYSEGVDRMQTAARSAEPSPHSALEVSVGDTPGCWLSDDLGGVDEIRPGNFVFFDAWQFLLGVCRMEEMAVAVACPVVAKHPGRHEVVIYGGAIHLSREFILQKDIPLYGLVAFPQEGRWGVPEQDCFVASLSQEHGIVRLSPQAFDRVQLGECFCVLPVHSCLAADCLGRCLTLDGRWLEMMKK
jgi:D-serine deaminase-like pyridoxal phosphate-dependent protein